MTKILLKKQKYVLLYSFIFENSLKFEKFFDIPTLAYVLLYKPVDVLINSLLTNVRLNI